MKKKNTNLLIYLSILCLAALNWHGCNDAHDPNVVTIGFLDIVEDATLAKAREGFVQALNENGWSEEAGNTRYIFRNAQGDMTTLIQSVEYFAGRPVDLIAANATVSMISAVQRSRGVPVCMMVAPEPHQVQLTNEAGEYPAHLFGVYETLEYMDTSVQIIRKWMPDAGRIGVIYNQAEPQSRNALQKIKDAGARMNFEIVDLPVTNSAETQLVTQAILNRGIDAFFAMPDNIIFASFEVVHKICAENNIPVFTSEAGLVSRGAVAAFGADFYGWGYQAGERAAAWLQSDREKIPPLQEVIHRQSVYNPAEVAKFGFQPDASFTPIKQE